MLTNLKGYRTIIFNLMMTLFMIISIWNPAAELPNQQDVMVGFDQVEAAIAFIWGLGNMILRAITDTPIFTKEPKNDPPDS